MQANGLKTIPIFKELPKYGYPINQSMISFDDNRLMATLSLKGMPFESESKVEIDMAFECVKGFFNQIAKLYNSDIAIWTHVVKTKDKLDVDYVFENEFVKSFSDKYLNSFSGSDFFKTEYFITFVMKYQGSLTDSEAELNDLLKTGMSVLSRFNPYLLKINDDGDRCENIEFLSFLLNNKSTKVPLTEHKITDVICESDLHFGYDLLEIRNANDNKSKYATFYELSSYPATTTIAMWDFILTHKSEFILTQSLILMKKANTLTKLKRQKNFINSSDQIETDVIEIENAIDAVTTSEIFFGDYHLSLAVFSDTESGALKDGTDLSSEFLSNKTMLKRSNLKSPFSFFSIMPLAKCRIASSPRTTQNLACGFSLHNYSTGKKQGNPIGDGSALLPLKSTSDTLFYLNCHASELNKNVTGEKYSGHTMLLGASGTGKTTLEGVMTGFLTRFNPKIFAIDYNRSTELYMRAYGGEYFTINEGRDTGLNPFQLDDSPILRSFLNRLVCRICRNKDGVIDEHEELEIKHAIDMLMKFDVENRNLSTILQSIQLPELRLRLKKWCRSENGSLAWCLDSPVNKFNPSDMDRVGFDSTMLLNLDADGQMHPASEPILSVLFFIKDLMQSTDSGRLMLTIVEEFWMPANAPLTSSLMKKVLKAGRLRNEFMILSSQSPEDAINCDLFDAIIQQTSTKIYLPNPDAEYTSYKKCNLTSSEFKKLQKLDKTSRTFLVKQSNVSCFAKLDLYGFDDHLPIISGTSSDIELCETIRKEFGESPSIWIPKFQEYKRNN